ncbi:MAG: hypothetical protein Q8S03_12540 [Brevundimonas sp.]|uniref:hypothetical protein n=1 Tax=Brevundimonas sp. TaxID=1871086 RepID=UPI0027326133|nr:hypothetical protein [Brevundimonas sp.]MDP3405514.1 hypothetical protein [Brevundimonas sp.]
MSHKDVGSRRLNLQVALGATLRALPRLWLGAAGALLVCTAVWLVPVFTSLTGGTGPAWAVAAGLTTLVAMGALARLSVTDDIQGARALGLGPTGLQFGWPEARLVLSALFCLIFLAMIVIVLTLAVLAIFGTAELDIAAIQARDWGSVGAPWKLGLLAALGVAAMLIPLLLAVRLSLFVPATLGRNQMVSLNSMGIAYGSYWPLLAGLILTVLPMAALLALIGTAALAAPVSPVIRVIGLVWLQLPLTLGLLGMAYRQLEYWTPGEAGQ